jgi:hypothetical protein
LIRGARPNHFRFGTGGQWITSRIAFTAFAVFWTVTSWVMMFGMPGRGEAVQGPGFPFDFFPCFGLPFIVIGLSMLSAPLWYFRLARIIHRS